MKKRNHCFFALLVFIAGLFYLHQKIEIYVQAYRLSSSFAKHNELVDKRDYLMYNLSKEISIVRVNQWAQRENFHPVDSERVLAFRSGHPEQEKDNLMVQLLDRFLGASATTSTALADETQ